MGFFFLYKKTREKCFKKERRWNGVIEVHALVARTVRGLVVSEGQLPLRAAVAQVDLGQPAGDVVTVERTLLAGPTLVRHTRMFSRSTHGLHLSAGSGSVQSKMSPV